MCETRNYNSNGNCEYDEGADEDGCNRFESRALRPYTAHRTESSEGGRLFVSEIESTESVNEVCFEVHGRSRPVEEVILPHFDSESSRRSDLKY
jgi:hypothetical protein